MPLAPVPSRPVKYKGCPPDCRHIVFVKPSGQDMAALLRVDPTWNVDLFVEEEFHRFFMVASSPDLQQLRIERWLPSHGPTRFEATTQAEQAASLGGKHAGNATAAELADESVALLTANDQPVAIPPRGMLLVPMVAPNPAAPDPKGQKGDYTFLPDGPEPVVRINLSGVLVEQKYKTEKTEADLIAAFCHADQRSAYFLFDQGTDYFLEAVEFWGSAYRRREATSTKASHGGAAPLDVVTAMEPTLAKA